MNRWKRWKRKLQLIFDPTTRQIAAAIRLGETKERNRAKREAQNKPDVWIDKAMQAQAQAQIGCYEPPERNTDKPTIPPALQDPKYVERIRTQHELPRLPRKLQLTRYDGPPLLDVTQVRIPTWIL